MNWKKIFGAGLKVADAGAAVGLPVATQIDAIADAIKGAKGKTKTDAEQLGTALAGLTELKLTLQPAGRVEHKRLKVAVLNAVAVVAIYLGFPEELADQIAMLVTGPLMAFILGDSIRASR